MLPEDEVELGKGPTITIPAEVSLGLIESLSDLCEMVHSESPEELLIMTSYFLTQIERVPTFSLKKINALILKSGFDPVNHQTLESILEEGLLEMVPDTTGEAEVAEYHLTPKAQTLVQTRLTSVSVD